MNRHNIDALLKATGVTPEPTSTSTPVFVKSEAITLPEFIHVPSTDIISSVNKRPSTTDSGAFANTTKRNKTDVESDCQYIVRKDFGTWVLHLHSIDLRKKTQSFHICEGEVYNKCEHDGELKQYKVATLNADQKLIWDFVRQNHTKIIVIQAGPGCGKSYTLKSIAYNMPKDIKIDTIIYKNDLLSHFKYNSRRWTVAKFVMTTLGLTYYQYKAFDILLSSKITSYEFILVIVSMLKRAKLPNLKGGLVFLDEYTIVSKPILLVTLILLEHHKIGAIICGDRNQLQNIFNSRHATLSSHKLAASFAVRQFHMHINERCSDVAYNKIIAYFAKFSSDKKLDAYAFAMISAIFLRQLIEPPNYHQVHLAGTHQELADLAHMLVCHNKYPTDFYAIDQSRLRDKDHIVQAQSTLQPTNACLEYNAQILNNELPRVNKFLPYIPLVCGAKYFVNKHSQFSQGILEAINRDNTLCMKMDDGSRLIVNRNTSDDVIFEPHKEYLLAGQLGKLYAYPIYPANFMSIHKCQGCTITDNLDLILHNTQYQGLYVALSRVTTPTQISRISIPDQISYIVSTIINFPQHAVNKEITVEDLQSGMMNYVLYDVSRDITQFATLISDFILSTDIKFKTDVRMKIIDLSRNYPKSIVNISEPPTDTSSNLLTMSLIIKYRDVFKAVACLDEIDRNVWIHEFLLVNPEMACLLSPDFKPNSAPISQFEFKAVNELTKMADLNNTYTLEMSTVEYIDLKSKAVIRMNEDDRKANKKFMVKSKDEYMSYESSEFCAKVYQKLSNKEPITESWLIDELKYMTTVFRNDITEQPKKKETNIKSAVKKTNQKSI